MGGGASSALTHEQYLALTPEMRKELEDYISNSGIFGSKDSSDAADPIRKRVRRKYNMIMKQYRDSQGKKNKAVSNGGLDDGSLRPGTCSKRRGFHSSNDASEAFRARQRLARLQAPRGSLPPLPLMRGPGREGNRRQMQQLFLQGERTKGGEGGGSDETIQEDRWTPPHASRHLATNGSGNSGTHSLMCDLCQATFLSSTLMEKHFKYSERHALNLKARDESRAVLLRADKISALASNCIFIVKKSLLLKKCAGRSLAVRRWHWAKDRVLMQLSKAKANEALISSLSRPTIEASLIYSGTKIFWQSRMKVDLYFYLHLPQNCIEVISFDTNLNRELNRLYLNYSAARECVRRDFVALSALSIAEQFVSILASTDEANEYEEEKEEEEDCKDSNYEEGKTIEKKKTVEQLPAAIMTEEVAQNKLSTFILSRLHVDKFIGSFLPEVTFEHREDDDHQIDEINLSRDSSSCSLSSLVYSARPADVAPVSVTHRRWTSIDSFRQTSSAFMTDIQALQVACCKAEILTVALSESVDSFLETLDAPKMRASIKMSSTSSSSSSSGELCRPSIKRLTADIVRRS